MIKTKSILRPKDESDGIRISVMSRHTLNDGITPHPQIYHYSYDEWLKILAPPEKLLGDYYIRKIKNLEDVKKYYITYLRNPEIKTEVLKLAKRGMDEIITLLCVENLPIDCHRKILAEECKRYFPSLILKIN